MGKKAIVTGASRGIGRGIALCLAEEGYDLALSYSSKQEEAMEVCREIRGKCGCECHVLQAKLDEPGAGVEFFHRAVEALGGLDLLVNNAGITIFENILDLTEEAMDRLIALDLKNYLILMREAGRYMAKRGIRGSIVNITSSRGTRAYPEDAVYGGIKAALDRAVQSVALDLAPYGIRANNVAPGAIRVRSDEELAAGDEIGKRVGFWDEIGESIPLERSGLPRDVGAAVAYLAGDAAEYITGITLRVDGGLILPGLPEAPRPGDRGWGYTKKKPDELQGHTLEQ